MASQKSSSKSSQSKQPSQGAGRKANSEPKLQVFKGFTGMNFQHNFELIEPEADAGDQTDLQMTYVAFQGNASVEANNTIEVREEIYSVFKAPEGVKFTGPVCLIEDTLYAAMSNGNIAVGQLPPYDSYVPDVMDTYVTLQNESGSTGHTWTSLNRYDNKLICLTEENEMWTGDLVGTSVVSISNAKKVPDPTTDFTGHITGKGTLTISQTMSDATPFRVMLAHTYVNKYGPTKVSPNTTFYASAPPTEWHAGCYLAIDGTIPSGYDIKAVELYYSTDNAMSLLFLGRVDVGPTDTTWVYNWYGYVDATSMWALANLTAPTENYTGGVPASRMCDIDGRLYFWGDSDNPYRLYIGGNPGNLLSISPGTGGGFADVEPGTGQEIRYVCKYKTQSGNSIVTILCDSPNSRKEQRFNLVEDSISLSNEQSMKSWHAEQVAGAVGCKSYDGAVVCEDGLYSISRYGLALTTMTMEYNSQIRTTYVSDPVKPIFADMPRYGTRLSTAVILEIDGIIYMSFGTLFQDHLSVDNMMFCYDIDLKAWWVYGLDVDLSIRKLFHVDWEGHQEGVGMVTEDDVYLLPTTRQAYKDHKPDHGFNIITGQISTQMPQQGWQYLSQLEFHFDYFVGDATFEVRMVDMFGRDIKVCKDVSETDKLHDYVVRMRIDQRVMSYVITITGKAYFRMTHFIARVYTLSNKVGQVWGFDDSIGHRSSVDVHPTFKCYNDVREAIFT